MEEKSMAKSDVAKERFFNLPVIVLISLDRKSVV